MPASAATVTGTLNVQINISSECSVSTGAALTFPTRGLLTTAVDGATASSGTGAIQVQCSDGTPYSIALGAGAHPATPGDVATRRMASGADYIAYQLYSDSSRTLVWGSTAGTNTVSATANGQAQSYQVFGRVPTQTTPPASTYTDSITVTVAY